jgi:hypothetical protein
MRHKKLIIGSNSKIVNEIKESLINFDFVSHTEVSLVDFSNYDFIFLFSWDHKSIFNNKSLIRKIPTDKLIFISTTAVLSLIVRKQWARYPLDKLEAEKLVFSLGGKVIRIGVWDESLLAKLYGPVGLTLKPDLINLLNEWSADKSSLLTPVKVVPGRLVCWKHGIGRVLYLLSIKLPQKKTIQIPLIAIGRLLGIHNYGYTADSLRAFSDNILIGFGAFGGYFYNEVKGRLRFDNVVVSDGVNEALYSNGFNGTAIGLSAKGLSNLWHGVHILKSGTNFVKKLIFRGKQYSSPLLSLVKKVESIEYDGNNIILNLTKEEVQMQMICNNVFLAAGTLENSRLLKSIDNLNFSFSDHELALVGELPKEALNDEYVSKIFMFFKYKKSIVFKSRNFEFLLDFHPYVAASKLDSLNFYNKSTFKIILNLLTQLKLDRINEAFFNRFKVSFSTKKMQLYVQVLAKNCIKYDHSNSLKRTRLSKDDWSEILDFISSNFPDFVEYKNFKSIDAQHVWGGAEAFQSQELSKLLNKKIFILGSPSAEPLTALHHTVDFRKRSVFEVDKHLLITSQTK